MLFLEGMIPLLGDIAMPQHRTHVLGLMLLMGIAGGCGPAEPPAAEEPREEELWIARAFTTAGGFTEGVEGPVCDEDGNLYAVSFEREGTIGKVTPDGVASVFAVVPDEGRCNGLRIDSEGYLICADYVRHKVHRIDPTTGEFVANLTAGWTGPEFYQPNDVAITSDDTIYFSDPDWTNHGGRIFMITPPPERKTVLLDDELHTTNGITASPGDKHIYVAQSYKHNILAYDRRADGTLENKRLLIDFVENGIPETAVPDGMRCDVEGNLFVAMYGLGKVLVVRPDGTLHSSAVETIGMGPANVTFGGLDRRTLYITEKKNGRIEQARVPFPGLR